MTTAVAGSSITPSPSFPLARYALFRVRFAQPLLGPLALGHSAHFGLGLFLAQQT